MAILEAESKGIVSIHAPARGATFEHVFLCRHRGCFNPRARAGRDFLFGFRACVFVCFNPRARAGRDRNWIVYAYILIGFNPRARAGRDISQCVW